MTFGRGNHRSLPWRVACLALGVVGSTCIGCSGDGPAKRWLNPLGFSSKPSSTEQPEFRQRVAKDPFPSASQVGLAMPPQTEKQE